MKKETSANDETDNEVRIIGFGELSVIDIICRVVLSLVIGGIIGMERGIKNHAAGFRTYMLVCLGASLVMMTNQYICMIFSNGDPSRLGAQVISGVGFLGAGTILITKDNRVKGLTTAAGLWSAACIGLAIGIGFYQGAIVVGVAVIMIMTAFQKLDLYFQSNSKHMNLYLGFASNEALNYFIEYCERYDYNIIDLQLTKRNVDEEGMIASILTLKNKRHDKHVEVIKKLAKIDGVKYIKEL